MKFFLTKTQVNSDFISFSFSNHSVFHCVYINLNTKFEKIWNKKIKIQVFLNLIGQYGVQKNLFIKNFNETNLCEVIT
jgi:hypothetical protein